MSSMQGTVWLQEQTGLLLFKGDVLAFQRGDTVLHIEHDPTFAREWAVGVKFVGSKNSSRSMTIVGLFDTEDEAMVAVAKITMLLT